MARFPDDEVRTLPKASPLLMRGESDSDLSPMQQAFGHLFEAIENSEMLAGRLTDRLVAVLNPKAMEAKKDVDLRGNDGSTSEYVSTVRVQALRIELLNERLQTLIGALEV